MSPTKDLFVVDRNGNLTAVLIEAERYRELLEATEELDAVRAFDQAKGSGDQAVSLSQAIWEIEIARD